MHTNPNIYNSIVTLTKFLSQFTTTNISQIVIKIRQHEKGTIAHALHSQIQHNIKPYNPKRKYWLLLMPKRTIILSQLHALTILIKTAHLMFLLLRGHHNSINCISMPKTQTLRPICINTIDFKHCCSFINTLPIFLHIQSLKFNAKQISPKRFIIISLHSLPTKFMVMQTHSRPITSK